MGNSHNTLENQGAIEPFAELVEYRPEEAERGAAASDFDFLGLLRRRWWVILVLVAVVYGAGWLRNSIARRLWWRWPRLFPKLFIGIVNQTSRCRIMKGLRILRQL